MCQKSNINLHASSQLQAYEAGIVRVKGGNRR